MTRLAKLVGSLAAALTLSAPAYGYVSTYQVGFGPHIGSGSISNGANVRNASGYSLSLERHWPLGTSGIAIGPRFEVSNSFLSTREKADGLKSAATYDNRFVAAGVTLSHSVGNDHTFAQGAYLSAVVGRGYTKLTVDESTDRTYKQNLFGKISGNYAAGELGGWIPLKGNFGLNIAFMGSMYRADQSDATGTYEGDEIAADGTLSLVQGGYEAGELDRQVTIRTYAAKVGLALGF